MSKAEEQALKVYPVKEEWMGNQWNGVPIDVNATIRVGFIKGYNQAEQDLMEKFKMWVAYNGYTAKDAEVVYNDFKQFITEN